MKKFLATALSLLLVTLLGTATAQDLADAESTAAHQVQVLIPEVLFVRIVGTDPMVTFNLTLNVDAYLVAADDGTAITSTGSTMTDVEVWANGGWGLTVSAVEFDDAGSLSVTNIEVIPTATAAVSVTSRMDSFRLNETGNVAEGGATSGWASVGIGGLDYGLYVDGSEADGTHTTTVTYTIADL